jgi:hypothetical protein
MSRVSSTTSESGKNASGQEAFGSKLSETPVVESLAASAADMTSAAVGAGTTVVFEADRARTSAPPTAGGEGGDRGTSGPQSAPGLEGIMEEGARSVDDEDLCLYAGTPWEAEVVTNRRDLETFKEAARMIRSMLLVRTPVDLVRFLLWVFECREVQLSALFVVQSLAERAQARTGLLREAANTHAEATAAHEVKLQAEIAPAREIHHVKEVMARYAQKEAADLKKLEDADQKAKDAASDLQAVVEGESSTLPWADSTCKTRTWS